MESISFMVAAPVCLVAALGVVVARSPLRAGLNLIVTLCALAVMFGLLQAPFLAAMQVLVYAGAIMVLFLFVIMLLNLGDDPMMKPRYLAVSKMLGALGMVGLVVHGVRIALELPEQSRGLDSSVQHMGALLLSQNLFLFESISLLLLVAVVGAVVLGLKRLT